ncbi:MAG: tandem-95 repeat protein, partial [Chlorobiaceae bacterium]|nr:tandem-95 repeat protein [Chlorobiaceae bacterium]
AYTFSASDFGFSDLSDSPTNALEAVKITTLPSDGALTLDGNPIVTGQLISAADIAGSLLVYTPGLNGNGIGYASFTFQVHDNGGTANGGEDLDQFANTITLNVTAVNDAPVVQNDSYTTAEDTVLTVNAPGVLSNDSDVEGSSLTVTTYGTASHGTVTVNANGSLVYVPASNYNGTDTFTYTVSDGLLPSTATVTVSITAVNDAPVVQNDSYTMLEDTALTVTAPGVLLNDSDIEGSSLTVTTYGTASHGTVTVNFDGSLVYVPSSNFNGTDTFTYTVSDGTYESTATVTVTVDSVNDEPLGTNKTVTTSEDIAITFSVSDFGFSDPNDSPANALLAVKLTTLPLVGSLTHAGIPVVAGQLISAIDISNGQLVYTPGLNDNGTGYASFTFQVEDNGGTVGGGVNLDQSPNTITFNVTAVNDAPLAQNDSYIIAEDTALTVNAPGVLSNDSDIEGSSLTVTTYGTASHGTVSVNANGSLVYVPVSNYNGTDTFTYTISDGSLTSTATATVTITPVNDAPVVQNENYTTAEDTALTVIAPGVLQNDSDVEGSSLTVTTYGAVSHGTVTVNANGSLVYVPNSNYNGTDTFTYTVSDGSLTATATATVTITAVNDAPFGTDKTITTNEDTAYTFTVSDFGFSDSNDTPANALLAVKITTLPVNGSLTHAGIPVVTGQLISAVDISGNQLVYTPGLNGNGNSYAGFTFQVEDDGGTTNGGVNLDPSANTITFNVTPVNDSPVAQNDSYTTAEDTALTVAAPGVLQNDSDIEGSSLTVTTYGSASHGTVTVNANGSLVYVPTLNYNGPDSFTYTVSDGSLTSTATATVAITAVNDEPSGTNKTVTTLEDSSYTFTVSDFGFNDLNDSPSNTLSAVKVTTLPVNGTLTLDGVGVTSGLAIAVADISSGKLVFTPAANANGTGYASFTFQVQDNGGTANGGVDTDQSPNTITLNVTSVNDLVSVTSSSVTVYESDLGVGGVTHDGTNPYGTRETATGTFTITAPDGLVSLTMNGNTYTVAQLVNTNNVGGDITVAGLTGGTLTLTDYNAVTGVVTYSYKLTAKRSVSGAGANTVLENVLYSATDGVDSSSTVNLSINIVDDVPQSFIAATANLVNSTTTSTVTMPLNFDLFVGADGVATGSPTFSITSGQNANDVTGTQLKIDGLTPLYWYYGADQTEIVAMTAPTGGITALRLKINSNGTYTLTSYKDLIGTQVQYDALDLWGGGSSSDAGIIDIGTSNIDMYANTKVGSTINSSSTTIGIGSGWIIYQDVIRLDVITNMTLSGINSYVFGGNVPSYVPMTEFKQKFQVSGGPTSRSDVLVRIWNPLPDLTFYGDAGDTAINIDPANITILDSAGNVVTSGTSGLTVSDSGNSVLISGIADNWSIVVNSHLTFGAIEYENPSTTAIKFRLLQTQSLIKQAIPSISSKDLSLTTAITDGDGDTVSGTLKASLYADFLSVQGTASSETLTGHDDAANNNKDYLFGYGGNDSLNSGLGDDVLLGGDGDDTLNGGAGADKLYGDAGDDLLLYDSADTLFDGGAGTDILRLSGGAGLNFTGTTLSDKIDSIEMLDLVTDASSNLVSTFSYQDLIGITDGNKTLYINGNASDTVNFPVGDGWSLASTHTLFNSVYYNMYTNSNDAGVHLYVQENITIT